MFYSQDFIMGTILMTNEQIGIYIKLLCFQHQHGGLINKLSFNELIGSHQVIKEKFIETDDGFFNKRLADEMVKRSKKSTNLSANARKRWENQCKSNAIASRKHMPIEDENEDEIKDDIKKEKEDKVRHLSFVFLLKEEYEKLIIRFGEEGTSERIYKLNNYIGSKGKKYKSHYHTILSWESKNERNNG